MNPILKCIWFSDKAALQKYSVKITSRFVSFSSESVIAIKLMLLLSIVVFENPSKQATTLQWQGTQTVFWLDEQLNTLEQYTSHM